MNILLLLLLLLLLLFICKNGLRGKRAIAEEKVFSHCPHS